MAFPPKRKKGDRGDVIFLAKKRKGGLVGEEKQKKKTAGTRKRIATPAKRRCARTRNRFDDVPLQKRNVFAW